jgi:hypothetical protein
MLGMLAALTASLARTIRSRRDVMLEKLALRQQLLVLTGKRRWSLMGPIDTLL